MKRLLSVFLALVLVLSLLPGTAFAQSGSGSLEQGYFLQSEQDQQFAGNVVGSGPVLAEGNHVRWFDRLADLPYWCTSFYRWLENNDSDNGGLIDPTTQSEYNGRYIHHLTDITSSVDFVISSGQTASEAANAAVYGDISENFAVAMDYAVTVYSAYDRDHPEVFWLTGNSRYSWSANYDYTSSGSTGTATYTMTLKFLLKDGEFDLRQTQYQSVAALEQAIARRDADVERILADCPVDSPADLQVRYLNQVLTETNAYNVSASASVSLDPWKCVSALAGGTGDQGPVCEGYARAFKVLCDRLGIGCVLVEGDAFGKVSATPEPHMWNYVQVGDGWYAVDVTWNDPLLTLNGDPALSGAESEDWLLLGSDSLVDEGLTFIQSHPVTNVVTPDGIDFANGPVLSANEFFRPDNYMDITPYRTGSFTAPVKNGYVFAGWYQDVECTKPVSTAKTSGWAYAKFVDAATLSVKFQLTAGTTVDSSQTDLRLLTAVDGLNYVQVAFRVTLAGSTQTLSSRTVYEQVRTGNSLISGADALFGEDARFFVTYTLEGVPRVAYGLTFEVVPCWRTLDGTLVEGIARSFTIGDVL